MSSTSAFRKIAAGSAALALAAAGSAMLASPAAAATSQTLNYSCSSTSLGNFPVTATHTFGDTVAYGGELSVTTTMTIPAPVVDQMRSFGITAIEGTAVGTASLAGQAISSDHVVTKTAVPPSGSMPLAAVGTADTAPAAGATPAGDSYDLVLVDPAAADITATLYTWYDDDGVEKKDPTAKPVNCELADGQNLAVGTVSVTQAATETTANLAYKNKAGKVVSKGLVEATNSSAAPVGDVKLILKRNGKKIDSDTVALKDGVAVMKTEAPKKGNYKLVAKYLGDDNFIASQDDVTKSF